LFIGTPLIVFLFLLYYGLPNLGVTLSPFVIAVFGFTFNVSAYNARYLTIAYKELDQAELESARAQGFSLSQVFRLITAPQSLRMSVPALTNQAIQNIKDSSIVFLIQYIEFFAQMQEVASRTFLFFKTYVFTALVYLLLVSVVVLAARRLERKLAIPGLS
jgi:polar amino acid transport system permease protein